MGRPLSRFPQCVIVPGCAVRWFLGCFWWVLGVIVLGCSVIGVFGAVFRLEWAGDCARLRIQAGFGLFLVGFGRDCAGLRSHHGFGGLVAEGLSTTREKEPQKPKTAG